mmetsp:Transcript_5948/g.25299  ORF Transcript_5948/g.25299 Transcript_5948/m.25299 type:complete len:467 (-) Transcript_5948:72-1472(-)
MHASPPLCAHAGHGSGSPFNPSPTANAPMTAPKPAMEASCAASSSAVDGIALGTEDAPRRPVGTPVADRRELVSTRARVGAAAGFATPDPPPDPEPPPERRRRARVGVGRAVLDVEPEGVAGGEMAVTERTETVRVSDRERRRRVHHDVPRAVHPRRVATRLKAIRNVRGVRARDTSGARGKRRRAGRAASRGVVGELGEIGRQAPARGTGGRRARDCNRGGRSIRVPLVCLPTRAWHRARRARPPWGIQRVRRVRRDEPRVLLRGDGVVADNRGVGGWIIFILPGRRDGKQRLRARRPRAFRRRAFRATASLDILRLLRALRRRALHAGAVLRSGLFGHPRVTRILRARRRLRVLRVCSREGHRARRPAFPLRFVRRLQSARAHRRLLRVRRGGRLLLRHRRRGSRRGSHRRVRGSRGLSSSVPRPNRRRSDFLRAESLAPCARDGRVGKANPFCRKSVRDPPKC